MEYYVYFVTETGAALSQYGFEKLSKNWPAGEAIVVQGSSLNDPETFLKDIVEIPPQIIVVSLKEFTILFRAGSGVGIEGPVNYIKRHYNSKRSTFELLLRYMSKRKRTVSFA